MQLMRPCVVVSPDEMLVLPEVLVAPMTAEYLALPTRIKSAFSGKEGCIALDQIRAVSKMRLIKKIGTLSSKTQLQIANCLQEIFAY